MRIIADQDEIMFSEWMQWSTYCQHPGIDNPGVYILARFADSMPASPDPLGLNVIYVGETCKSLKIRLEQFSRSAFQCKNGHSGGWKFNDEFNNGKPANPPSWLFVSILPVMMEETRQSAWIRLIERKIIWEFACKWQKLPQCNSK